jgi:periplasmic copper chaperone A
MRSALALAAVTAAALGAAASAYAHAHISPPVALAKTGQLFSLDVPTEKEGQATTKVVLTLPQGFSIDSFVDAPGWKRQVQSTGSGEDAVIQRVTWTGGHVPTDEISHFAFLGSADSDKTYTFGVEQTYSDGSIVNWNGPESSDAPAPTLEATSSLGGGGGGSSTLAIIALVVGVVGVLLAGIALVAKGGRQLA